MHVWVNPMWSLTALNVIITDDDDDKSNGTNNNGLCIKVPCFVPGVQESQDKQSLNLKILYKVKVKNDAERTHNCTKIMKRTIPHRMGKFKRQEIKLVKSNRLILLHQFLPYLWRDVISPLDVLISNKLYYDILLYFIGNERNITK